MNIRYLFILSFSLFSSCYELQAAENNPQAAQENIMNNPDVLDLVSFNFVITRDATYDKESWNKILRLVSNFIGECEATENTSDNTIATKIGNFSEDILKIKGLGIHGDLSVDVGQQNETGKDRNK